MEIEKLRARLKNASSASTEYRMTMVSARALLAEVEHMLAEIAKIRNAPPPEPVIEVRVPQSVNVDGGGF